MGMVKLFQSLEKLGWRYFQVLTQPAEQRIDFLVEGRRTLVAWKKVNSLFCGGWWSIVFGPGENSKRVVDGLGGGTSSE